MGGGAMTRCPLGMAWLLPTYTHVHKTCTKSSQLKIAMLRRGGAPQASLLAEVLAIDVFLVLHEFN